MYNPTPERLAIVAKLDDIKGSGYVDAYDDESCLDGFFTADQLRRIAAVMDELKQKA